MNDYVDFCNYVQPIVNGCAGFIKTDGYITHIPGTIIMMSADETCCAIIHIPVIYNIYMTSIINTFLAIKTPEYQSIFPRLIYFNGWNIKRDKLLYYCNVFSDIDRTSRCIYSEPDCFNIPGFEDAMNTTSIEHVNVSDGIYNYRIPASKSITAAVKADTISLKIYEDTSGYGSVKTVRYTIQKKKFKISVDVFSNIIML